MSSSVLFFRFVLIGLCVSLLRQWCDECKGEWGVGEWQVNNKISYDLGVKHLLHGHFRKTRLWRRVVGETRHSRGKGRPAWFLLGILLLSGDMELNPGPKTKSMKRAADKEVDQTDVSDTKRLRLEEVDQTDVSDTKRLRLEVPSSETLTPPYNPPPGLLTPSDFPSILDPTSQPPPPPYPPKAHMHPSHQPHPPQISSSSSSSVPSGDTGQRTRKRKLSALSNVPSSRTLEVSALSPASPPPPPVFQVVTPVHPDQIPQLTLPNITKYIPQILEIKAASLEEQLAVKDAPASSVELVLSAWLAGKGAPHSWKRLIWALDIIENKRRYKGPQSVADNIRKFAEPPQESTLSVENVAAVFMQIEGDVSSVLEIQKRSIGGCPRSVYSRISSLSGEEKIRAAASLYITSHGCPSWKLLSLLLYEVGEMKAAESAMTNFSKDPTFTVELLSEVIKDVEDWETISNYMGIDDHAISQIKSAHDQKGALVHHLVHVCPCVTWGNVVTALFHCGEEIAAEQASKYLPNGSDFSAENAHKYTCVLRGEEEGDEFCYSLEDFLTAEAITTWRELISITDFMDHCKYADSIRNFAEPVQVTDPTMTVENLTTVLMSAEESPLDIISNVEDSDWGGPFYDLMKRIESCIPSVEQQVKAAAMCYISSHPDQPTWKAIATAALYGEEVVVKEVNVAIKACDYCTRDSNFSIERINKVLEEVEDWVNVFLHLPLPYSLMERIESSENTTPKQALAEIVVRLNPAIDWERLAKALSDAGYRALAEDVTTKYVKGDHEDEVDEKEFLEVVQEAINKSGAIKQKLVHSVFLGSPGSGKSSLITRLVRKELKDFSPSTGVCEPVVIVDVGTEDSSAKHASVTVLQDGEWSEAEFEVSVVRQMNKESITITPKAMTPRTVPLPTPSTTSESASPVQTSTTMIAPPQPVASPHVSQPENPCQTSGSITSEMLTSDGVDLSRRQLLQPPPSPSIQNISSVIRKYGYSRVQRYLKNSYSIYLTDTGDQVEFQEMVPLLISGPSIFFFLFRIDQDLRSRFKISYRKKDRTVINSYVSSISTEDALLQCLASIDAMDVTAQSEVKTHQPLVFIVGTHKDLLGSNAEEKISEIDRQLNNLVCKHGYQHLVQYVDQQSNRLMFTVDNYSESEEDFERIRTRISEIVIGRNEFAIDYPISYMQFSLDLENLKKSIVSFDECVSLAAQYGISRDQVKHLLRFLHTRIGRIKYFPVEGLRNIIIREPQVLFNKVTDLIIETFSSKRLYRQELSDFKHRGIISASIFKRVITAEDGIDPNSFLRLLVHLRIISQITTSEDKEDRYFIPCVLNHVQASQRPEPVSNIPTLYIEFECNHCPKGIFGVLINTLLTVTVHSTFKWELIPDSIFRDQVSFSVGRFKDRVSLKFFSSHLQVGLSSRCAHISDLCNNVREVIEKSIHSSVKDLRYDSGKTQHYFCCKCELCSSNHRVNQGWVQGDYFMYCSNKHETCILSEDNLVWFQPKEKLCGKSDSLKDFQGLQPSVLNTTLGMEDHFQVTECLSDLTFKETLKLGSALGLLWSNLKKMTVLPHDLVERWLNSADNVIATSGRPTWASLINALEKIELKGVAERIKKSTSDAEGTPMSYQGITFHGDPVEITSSTDISDLGISVSSLDNVEVSLMVHPCLTGPFKIPDGHEPVSPTYLIRPKKEVMISIQHYASLQSEKDCEDMVFLSANSTPTYHKKKPIYIFKKIIAGRFKLKEQKGDIQIRLKSEQILQIGRNKRSASIPAPYHFQGDKIYSLRLYPIEDSDDSYRAAVFCVCVEQPIYRKYCDEVIHKMYQVVSKAKEKRSMILNRKINLKSTEEGVEFNPSAVLARCIHPTEGLNAHEYDVIVIFFNENFNSPNIPQLNLSGLSSESATIFELSIPKIVLNTMSNSFIQEIEKAKANDEEFVRKMAHFMFIGPPGFGKSSLMDRLLGEPPRKNSEGENEMGRSSSTDICDSAIPVHVNLDLSQGKLCMALIQEDYGKWDKREHDQSAVQQLVQTVSTIPKQEKKREKKSKHLDSTSASITRVEETASFTPSEDETPESATPLPAESMEIDDGPSESMEVDENIHTRAMMKKEPKAFDKPVDAAGIIKKYGFEKFLNCKSDGIVYLRDTGGQVEFQEMLPLLINGPSIFFFVLKLDQDINSKFEIKYRMNANESSNCYTSSISTKEALLQCLASVYAMDITVGGKVETQAHQPLVFIIGTHKDRLHDSAEERISQLNKDLKSLIEVNGFQDLVQYADNRPEKETVMFTVSNISDDPKDFDSIRNKVNELIKNYNWFSIKYRLGYLLFYLELQGLKDNVIDLDKCRLMAARYGITGNAALFKLLQFLHIRMGVIRHYNTEGLEKIVVREPQILFKKLTQLVIRTFPNPSKKFAGSDARDVQKGIVTKSIIDIVLDSKDIEREDFLKILTRLRIVAQISDEKYFIPGVLDHVPISDEEGLQTEISPLVIGFECRHCPKGLFGVLVTRLMSSDLKEGDESSMTFKLIKEKIHKNYVCFEVHNSPDFKLDVISLKAHFSHIEIKFRPEKNNPELGMSRDLKELCNDLRIKLKKLVMFSLSDLNYDKDKVEPVVCFKCENEDCKELHKVEKGRDYFIMHCRKTRKPFRIPKCARCWYNEDCESFPSDEVPNLKATPHQRLTKDDKPKVIQLLKNLKRDQLNAIGAELGLLKPHKKKKLSDIITAWLNEDDNVKEESGTPSWASLIAAMERSGDVNVTFAIEDIDVIEEPTALLTMDDHSTINGFLKKLDDEQVIALGTRLGLLYPSVKRMKILPADMIEAWLRKEENVTKASGAPSWNSLVDALKDIGQNGIASDIKKKYLVE